MSTPNLGKRKDNPYGGQAVKAEPGVKQEPGLHVKTEGGDVKRQKGPAAHPLSSSHGHFQFAQTAAVAMLEILKAGLTIFICEARGTIGWDDAWFQVQQDHPAHKPDAILDVLRKMEKVDFNPKNRVFTYIPDLTFANAAQLRQHIRTHSTDKIPISLHDKTVKDALPPKYGEMLAEMEQKGEVLIMKALTGSFKDVALPKLGGKLMDQNTGLYTIGLNDPGSSGYGRYRCVWWDTVRERGRAGDRVDQSFVKMWGDVQIEENESIEALLRKEHLDGSKAPAQERKVIQQPGNKKKKQTKRALKITNTHMKGLGIDFSKDYERPE